MKDTGCSGYVVKASEFTKLLPPEIQPMYEKALADNDLEYVDELLDVHAPLSFPTFDSPFILGDEDNADNLERGKCTSALMMTICTLSNQLPDLNFSNPTESNLNMNVGQLGDKPQTQ